MIGTNQQDGPSGPSRATSDTRLTPVPFLRVPRPYSYRYYAKDRGD